MPRVISKNKSSGGPKATKSATKTPAKKTTKVAVAPAKKKKKKKEKTV